MITQITPIVSKEGYSRGDVRMCRAPMCTKRVVFYDDKGWLHIPDESGFDSNHKAVPFKEHKHVFRITGANNIAYFYECRICTYRTETNKRLMHYLLTKQWRDVMTVSKERIFNEES